MAIVGYYSMTSGQGLAAQVDEITNNGDTAVNVTVPDAAQLSALDSLYVVNPSNGSFGAEYTANFADISAAVNGGMNLIIFDRYVTNAQTILPGGSGITALRDFSDGADINVAAGAPTTFTNGPNGTITDATFDGGNWSSHGYVELSSLPPGATPLLTTSDPTHITAFTYPVGAGNVFYSTMPLDYYTGSNNAAITGAEIFTLFGNVEETQNILCFASGTQIETPNGSKAIETLRAGDAVVVRGGATKSIRWISASYIDRNGLKRAPKHRPVRITAGALGGGRPTRDLLVSRQHRMLVSSKIAHRMFGCADVLVSAIKLTELPGIHVDEDVETVTYFHMLFDDHQIVMAEGAASESLYTGPEALKSVPAAAQAELLELFPDLATMDYEAAAAAYIPKGRAQKQLVARHLKNQKPLIERASPVQ